MDKNLKTYLKTGLCGVLMLLLFVSAKLAGPAISMESNTYNYGRIEAGPKYNHSFRFRNTGDAPLQILNVIFPKPGITGQFSTSPVQPGNSAEIMINYGTMGKIGPFSDTVRVRTNIPGSQEIKLILKGVLHPEEEMTYHQRKVRKRR